MIEGIHSVAQRQPGKPWTRYACILCGRLREVALSMHSGPVREGYPHGLALCRECADQLTHAAPRKEATP